MHAKQHIGILRLDFRHTVRRQRPAPGHSTTAVQHVYRGVMGNNYSLDINTLVIIFLQRACMSG